MSSSQVLKSLWNGVVANILNDSNWYDTSFVQVASADEDRHRRQEGAAQRGAAIKAGVSAVLAVIAVVALCAAATDKVSVPTYMYHSYLVNSLPLS